MRHQTQIDHPRRRSTAGSVFWLVVLLLLGGASALLFTRFRAADACGKAGAAPCPPPELENGIGTTLSRPQVCRDVGYLCRNGGLMGGERVMRWDRRKGVLYVRAPLPPDLPDSVARAMRAAAVAGILDWSGHPFPIVVDSGRIPTRRWDVELFWTPTLNAGAGVATVEYQETADGPRYRVRAIAALTGSWQQEGRPASYWEARGVAAHEMGHALGLGHSDRREDLMYPDALAGERRPSRRDLQTVDALYALPAGALLR